MRTGAAEAGDGSVGGREKSALLKSASWAAESESEEAAAAEEEDEEAAAAEEEDEEAAAAEEEDEEEEAERRRWTGRGNWVV